MYDSTTQKSQIDNILTLTYPFLFNEQICTGKHKKETKQCWWNCWTTKNVKYEAFPTQNNYWNCKFKVCDNLSMPLTNSRIVIWLYVMKVNK